MNTATTVPGWSYRPAITRATTALTFLVSVFLLGWGWNHRDLYYFNPAEGTGYALGIIGGSLMLLLAFYPLRKNARWMRGLGAIRHWFRMHMVFGIAGPIAILYHCNFGTGATNSNVALGSMLVVASSGLFGRYLYARIHHSLYGGMIRVQDLRREWNAIAQSMHEHSELLEPVAKQLEAFEAPVMATRRTLGGAIGFALTARWRRMRILRKESRGLADLAPGNAERQAQVIALLQARLNAGFAVQRYNAFERFFHLWHLLHMPLFVLLIITGIVHVIAVHLY